MPKSKPKPTGKGKAGEKLAETPAGWTTHVGLAQALCCVKTTGVQPLSPQSFCTALALVPGLLEVLSVPVANNKNVIVAYDAKGTAGLTLTDIAAMVFAQWWPTTFHPDRTRVAKALAAGTTKASSATRARARE